MMGPCQGPEAGSRVGRPEADALCPELSLQNELLIASLAVIHGLGHTAYHGEVIEPASLGHVRSETIEVQADKVQRAGVQGAHCGAVPTVRTEATIKGQ